MDSPATQFRRSRVIASSVVSISSLASSNTSKAFPIPVRLYTHRGPAPQATEGRKKLGMAGGERSLYMRDSATPRASCVCFFGQH